MDDPRIARITRLAERVLESQEDAEQFLTTPHPLLDDAMPLRLAETDAGAERVAELLWRIEFSLPV